MKQLLRLTAITGLLCLAALATACGSIPSPNPAYPGPETEPPKPTEESTPLPVTEMPATAMTLPPMTVVPIPTIPNHYPPPTEARPTDTLPPEPRPTATPIPTITPPPTTVPLPPPAFYVLWAETTYTDGQPNSGTIWLADPRDPANRQKVTQLDDKEIYAVVLSPNGQQVTLITNRLVQGGGPLWVMNLDGTDLRPIANADATQILWSQDSRTIFYRLFERGRMGIEQIDIESGETQRILILEPDISLRLLGWSTDSHWLYHTRLGQEGYELWKIREDGSESQFIITLGESLPYPDYLLLSPNGGKILIGTYQSLRWVSTSGQGEGTVPLPYPEQGYQILWGHGENEVIVGQTDTSGVLYHLYSVNIQSQQTRELATFEDCCWRQLALSPDRHWLMASQRAYSRFYWIHLPTGTAIPAPCRDCRIHFIAWIPKGSGP